MRFREVAREVAMSAAAIVVMPVACAAGGLVMGAAASVAMAYYAWTRRWESVDGSREG